jgi:hypothetical protein
VYRVLLLLILPLTAGAEQLTDPTMPPDFLQLQVAADGDVDTAVEKFRLSGILLSPEGSSAIVNGKRVKVGEEINGGQIVAIEAGMVSIQTAVELVELRLIPMQIKTTAGRGVQ